jgi:hypothetical protein
MDILQLHALRSYLHSLPYRTQLNSLLQLSWLQLLGTGHIENVILLLLRSCQLPWEHVYRAVAQKFPRRGPQKTPFFYCCLGACCGPYLVRAAVYNVAYEPVTRQRPRNKQRVQPLLCNRQINKRPFLSNGLVNTFPWKRYPGYR